MFWKPLPLRPDVTRVCSISVSILVRRFLFSVSLAGSPGLSTLFLLLHNSPGISFQLFFFFCFLPASLNTAAFSSLSPISSSLEFPAFPCSPKRGLPVQTGSGTQPQSPRTHIPHRGRAPGCQGSAIRQGPVSSATSVPAAPSLSPRGPRPFASPGSPRDRRDNQPRRFLLGLGEEHMQGLIMALQ